MKAIMLAIFLITFNVSANEEDETEVCEALHGLAKAVVEARYRDVEVVEAIKVAGNDELSKQIIILAYQLPRYSTDKYQVQQAIDFANDVYMACLNR